MGQLHCGHLYNVYTRRNHKIDCLLSFTGLKETTLIVWEPGRTDFAICLSLQYCQKFSRPKYLSEMYDPVAQEALLDQYEPKS